MCDCNFYDTKLSYSNTEVTLYAGEVGLSMDVESSTETQNCESYNRGRSDLYVWYVCSPSIHM